MKISNSNPGIWTLDAVVRLKRILVYSSWCLSWIPSAVWAEYRLMTTFLLFWDFQLSTKFGGCFCQDWLRLSNRSNQNKMDIILFCSFSEEDATCSCMHSQRKSQTRTEINSRWGSVGGNRGIVGFKEEKTRETGRLSPNRWRILSGECLIPSYNTWVCLFFQLQFLIVSLIV